jgi:hypothetical protein
VLLFELVKRTANLITNQRTLLDKTIEALLKETNEERINSLKSIQRKIVDEEFGRISKLKEQSELVELVDGIIDELKNKSNN